MEDWHNLGPHYDKTLMAWNGNFQEAWPRLKKKYDERFKRMWEYYLLLRLKIPDFMISLLETG